MNHGSRGIDDSIKGALLRLEEAATIMHTQYRQLRRSTAASQHHLLTQLHREEVPLAGRKGTDTAPTVYHLPLPLPVAANPEASAPSYYRHEAERMQAMSAYRLRESQFMARKLLLASLWKQYVINSWFNPHVVDGFYYRVTTKLSELRSRLERAAAVVHAERLVETLPVIAKHGIQLKRKRRLGEALSLTVRVAREFINCTGNGTERLNVQAPLGSPLPFTSRDFSEVVQYLVSRAVERREESGAGFAAAVQSLSLLQTLDTPATLQCLAKEWKFDNISLNHNSTRSIYKWYSHVICEAMREKARVTSNVLVNRRQQREQNEAHWCNMRTKALTVLRNASCDGTGAATASEGPGDDDTAAGQQECLLSLVLSSIQQEEDVRER